MNGRDERHCWSVTLSGMLAKNPAGMDESAMVGAWKRVSRLAGSPRLELYGVSR
jgi:hypothetical protein